MIDSTEISDWNKKEKGKYTWQTDQVRTHTGMATVSIPTYDLTK